MKIENYKGWLGIFLANLLLYMVLLFTSAGIAYFLRFLPPFFLRLLTITAMMTARTATAMQM